MHSIAHSRYKNILTDKHQSIDEYNPMLGSFKADVYSGNIQVGNTAIHNCTIACSEKYDMAMNMVMGQNVEGFLGIGSLEGKQIFLSYKNRKIGLQNAL
jgi:hypothetical protein